MSEEIDPQAPEPAPQPAGFDGVDDSGDAEPEGPSGAGAVFGPFMQAIVAPAQCFEALKAKPKLAIWIVVWIAVFSTVLAFINMPITQQVMAATARAQITASGADVTPEQMQQQTDLMMAIGKYTTYGQSVLLVVLLALTALVIWVLAAIMGGKGASFGGAFSVAAAAGVIKPLLYSVYVTLILQMNPPEIRRIEDVAAMTPTLGLDLILSGPNTAPWLNAVFMRVDVFSLWWMFLVVSGSMALLKVSKAQGIVIAVVIWLIGTGVAMLGALAQGLSG